jgi:hypothetical protein
LRTTRSNFARPLTSAAAVVAAAALALAAAGCGGGGESQDARTAEALAGLYAIDHDGTQPTDDQLDPYEKAFSKVREDCTGSVEELASGIQDMAFSASNGSGTEITNLEALHAVGRYLDANPRPADDCRGIFVGVEAYLEGGALE